jgi:GT2 family glycosyltransferase
MVYHHDEPTVIQSAGGALGPQWEAHHTGQNEDDIGQFPNTRPVSWISGCAVMVRRQAIEQLGMLDERFFYYWEEVEWCLRIGRGGWQIVHVPAAKLWHKGVQRNYQPKPSVAYYNTRNRFLMLEKQRAPLRIWLGAWLQTLRTLASYSIRPKWRTKRAHRDAQLRGMLDFLRRRWGQAQL